MRSTITARGQTVIPAAVRKRAFALDRRTALSGSWTATAFMSCPSEPTPLPCSVVRAGAEARIGCWRIAGARSRRKSAAGELPNSSTTPGRSASPCRICFLADGSLLSGLAGRGPVARPPRLRAVLIASPDRRSRRPPRSRRPIAVGRRCLDRRRGRCFSRRRWCTRTRNSTPIAVTQQRLPSRRNLAAPRAILHSGASRP